MSDAATRRGPREQIDGNPAGPTIAYVERGLGGTLAAVLLAEDGLILVQFDPAVMKPQARHHLRSWALHQVAVGWMFALATQTDIAALMS